MERLRERSLRHGRSDEHGDRPLDAGRGGGQALRAHQGADDDRRPSEGGVAGMSTRNGAYVAPVWLPGGHAQTIYPALRRREHLSYRRQRIDTPDGDFVDFDWLEAAGMNGHASPLVVLFHGLEGN